jgi:hypothetical protein
MHSKTTLMGGALAAMTLVPALANASLVLDTGTPTAGASLNEVDSSPQWFAAEFSLSAGSTVTALSVYLQQPTGLGQVGDTYTLDIFGAAGFTGRQSGQQLDYSTTGKFTASDAWNTTNLAGTSSGTWTATTTGSYWVAIEVSSSAQTRGLDLPTTTNNGTAPASGFAFLDSNTNNQFTTNGAPDVGFQVTATTAVPVPAGASWLLGGGLLGIGVFGRRRRTAASAT